VRLPRRDLPVGMVAPVKDKNLAKVCKGFRSKRLPQSVLPYGMFNSFAMTVRDSPLSQFPAKRVLTRNDEWCS